MKIFVADTKIIYYCDFVAPLNFDPVKEILRIRCLIYILMKKMVILRKTLGTMKSFASSAISV